MADIIDIAGFKKRRLAKFEAEWDQYMVRAEQFKKDGKQKFADEMLAKAKVVRQEITKLRGPEPKRPPNSPYLIQESPPDLKFTFLGFAGVDKGHPKEPLTPPE